VLVGFENSLTPCCHGNSNSTLYSLACGHEDSEGKPLYTLCEDPSKAVLYDAIHPSQAASKVMVDLYASVPGFTLEGPMLNTWIRKNNI
jgi:phospholipase/lecithinase/hemolysin